MEKNNTPVLSIFRGKEFRTAYSRIGEIRAVFSNATVIALTASAPPSMLPAIKDSLSLHQDCEVLAESANRENIFYIAQRAPTGISETFNWVVNELRTNKEKTRKMIIYCRSIKAVGEVYQYLVSSMGENIYAGDKRSSGSRLVAMFHHATVSRIKKKAAATFPRGDSPIRIIIGTVAFGLGIDC